MRVHLDGWLEKSRAHVDLTNPSPKSIGRDNATFHALQRVARTVIEVHPWSWEFGKKLAPFYGDNGIDLGPFTGKYPCQGNIQVADMQCAPSGAGHQCTVSGITLAAREIARQIKIHLSNGRLARGHAQEHSRQQRLPHNSQ